jgi:GGDEF domain-containing protein
MARVIRRMEAQKSEIQGVLEALEDAANETEVEAWRDPKSWLPARDYFMERLEDYSRRVSAGRARCCLLALGVEGVNPDGDAAVMKEFGELVSGLVRSSDFFGHLGDGLVGLGAPNVQIEGAETAAKRIANSLREFAEKNSPQGAEGLAVSVIELNAANCDPAENAVEIAKALRQQALEEKTEVKVHSPAPAGAE